MENRDQFQESKSKYDCLLFDLDDTLYPFSSGLSAHVTDNIQEYMLEKLGIQEDKVPELCVSLYKIYGTTMAGLKAIGYDFDYDDFHSFVHGRLPYNLLKPDPVLRGILLSLPFRKIIFTNADDAHAKRVLHRLGLEDCFERIISSTPSNQITSTLLALIVHISKVPQKYLIFISTLVILMLILCFQRPQLSVNPFKIHLKRFLT
ncbi:hypothetical protein RYX36_010953 [Vicia faba]